MMMNDLYYMHSHYLMALQIKNKRIKTHLVTAYKSHASLFIHNLLKVIRKGSRMNGILSIFQPRQTFTNTQAKEVNTFVLIEICFT